MRITIGNKTEDYMKVMGIQTYPFTESMLKTVYRELAKKYHPDIIKGDGKEMKAINEAYKWLLPLALRNGDLSEKPVEKEPEDMFDLTDTCPDCKGEKYTKTYVACTSCSVRAFDFFGSYYTPTGRIKGTCSVCAGRGYLEKKGKKIVCDGCNGKKKFDQVCPVCNGTKTTAIKNNCFKCHGSGIIKLNPFNPVIPKGAVLQ